MAEESILPPMIDFPIEKELLDEVVSKAKDWAIMHGAGMRSKTNFNSDVLYVRFMFKDQLFQGFLRFRIFV